MTPFTTAVINVGEQGITGSIGPNVKLIAFNSGDFILPNDASPVAVGLGVAQTGGTPTLRFQLGVPIEQQCTLSNCEGAFSGNITSEEDSFIRYNLIILRSFSNDGTDYTTSSLTSAFFD